MTRAVIFLCMAMFGMLANAYNWRNLWSTPDQQAQVLMQKGEFSKANSLFENKEWAAVAHYKVGEYEKAVSGFGASKTEQSYYNQGNAFARLGKYEQAIKAYDNALALNAKNEDASFNRKLVETLLNKEQDKKNQQDDKNKQEKNQKENQQDLKQPPQNQEQKSQDQKKQSDNQQEQKPDDQKQQPNQKRQNPKQPTPSLRDKKKKQPAPRKPNKTTSDLEKQQAKQQWLQLIPDEPGGLMREKFLRDHLRRERGWLQ